MGKFENLINARHRLCEATNPAANDPNATPQQQAAQAPQAQQATAPQAQQAAEQTPPTAQTPGAATPPPQPAPANPAATPGATQEVAADPNTVRAIQGMLSKDPRSAAEINDAATGKVYDGLAQYLIQAGGSNDMNVIAMSAKQALTPQR